MGGGFGIDATVKRLESEHAQHIRDDDARFVEVWKELNMLKIQNARIGVYIGLIAGAPSLILLGIEIVKFLHGQFLHGH